MMKKKFLIASLLLAASTFGAEETKWDFTGSNVEAKLTVYSSDTDASYAGKDEDLILKVSKKVDDKTTVSFKYDTDDSNPDYKVEAIVNRKFNEFLEAQMDLDIITGNKVAASNKGLGVEEDYDSDKVYIKYTPNNKLAVKFNPFDIDLTVGSVFETANEQKTPGLQAEYKLSDTTSAYAGIGTGKYDDGISLKNIQDSDGNETTVLGLKAGMTYKTDKTSVKAAFSMNTQDDSDITLTNASPLKSAASIIAEQKMGKLTVQGEAIVTQVNKASTAISGLSITDSETGIALFAKAKYSLEKMTPYLQVIHADEYAYFDDGDYSATIKDSDVQSHGGLTAIEVGNEFVLKGGLKVVPYIEMKSTEEKVFTDKDGNLDDKSVVAAVKVKLTF